MESTITLGSALEVLRKRYEKEYEKYDNNNYELDDEVNIDFEEIKTKKLVKKEEL